MITQSEGRARVKESWRQQEQERDGSKERGSGHRWDGRVGEREMNGGKCQQGIRKESQVRNGGERNVVTGENLVSRGGVGQGEQHHSELGSKNWIGEREIIIMYEEEI